MHFFVIFLEKRAIYDKNLYLYATNKFIISMRKLRLYILAIAAVCAVACAEETKKSSVPEFKSFEYELIEEGSYAFSVSYEHITNTADSEALAMIEEQNYLAIFGEFALEKQDLQRSCENFIDAVLENMQMFGGTDVECELHLYQVASLVRNNSVVCYDTVTETDFDGKVPMVIHDYECYDVASGNAYDFSYLSDGEWSETLIRVVFDKLKAEYGDRFYIVKPEYFYLPATTYLTDKGIAFFYEASSEIVDEEFGNITVELTDAELEATGAPLVWK